MSHRHDLRDRWCWDEPRERETPDIEWDADMSLDRGVGDPRWGTGGMRGDERGHRAVHEANERPWRRGLRPGGAASPQGEWESVPPPTFASEPSPSTPGSFVGRGPRGYRRSDERIREDVCERFTAHGELDPTDVEVHVRGGEVMLSGTISTRAQKRLAEDIVESVLGVVEVHNHLRVWRPFDPRPAVTAVDEGCVYEEGGSGSDHR